MDVQQVGADVVATVTGGIAVQTASGAFTLTATTLPSVGFYAADDASSFLMLAGQRMTSPALLAVTALVSTPAAPFAALPGGITQPADFVSGPGFGWSGGSASTVGLVLDLAPLTGIFLPSTQSTARWVGTQIADLGLIPGTYTWIWDIDPVNHLGAATDYFTIQVGAVPEPGSLALMALGGSVVAAAVRRRRHSA